MFQSILFRIHLFIFVDINIHLCILFEIFFFLDSEHCVSAEKKWRMSSKKCQEKRPIECFIVFFFSSKDSLVFCCCWDFQYISVSSFVPINFYWFSFFRGNWLHSIRSLLFVSFHSEQCISILIFQLPLYLDVPMSVTYTFAWYAELVCRDW